MAVSNRPVRLSKAAREFNISLDTIVEFLSQNGFTVERNPNTKLDSQMYGLLANTFQDEKHVKEAAQQKGLEFVGKETITIDDVRSHTDKKPEDDFISDDIYITDSGVGGFIEETKKTVEPKKKAAEKEKEVKKEEPKAPVAKEKEAKKEIKAAVKETVEKPKEPKIETEKTIDEKPGDTTEVKETEEVKEEIESEGIKVLGKVDLDSINQKTRPRKLTKEEKKKEAEAKRKASKPKEEKAKTEEKKPEVVEEKVVVKEKTEHVEEPSENVVEKVEEKEEEKDNFIPTKFQKLSGPVVVDKIELLVNKHGQYQS